MPSVVHVSDAPTPYREPVHHLVSEQRGGDYHVIYCQQRESHRQWDVTPGDYSKSFLREKFVVLDGRGQERSVNYNLDVWRALDKLNPQVVIGMNFNPTMLLAVAWCIRRKRKHIAFTDSWEVPERDMSIFHRQARRWVFRHSHRLRAEQAHAGFLSAIRLSEESDVYNAALHRQRRLCSCCR